MSHSSDDRRSGTDLDRRELLKLGALGVGGAALGGLAGCEPADGGGAAAPDAPPSPAPPSGMSASAPADPFRTPPMERVRIGFVGVGLQGGAHVRNFLRIDGVDIVALCDVDVPRMEEVASWVEDDGRPRPTLYGQGEEDFVRLCETEDLDLVFTATPWRWHVPVCVAAMENGKHAATEVPAAYTLEDCWRLVEVAEAQAKHCVMMENCNYDRPEMMVFNIVKQGLLGELLHAECGYLHDLRAIKFSDANEGLWRRDHSRERNGNLYPTHGLGPVANCMDINRGDRFDYLVSMSSPSRGLQDFAQDNFPEGDSKRDERFALGDVNASLIKTARGRTIYVVHDTNLPRPYSRIHMVQGSRGLFQGYPNRLHIEGRSPSHRWENYQDVLAEFDHPLWKDLDEMSQGAGHGGMDFIEDYRLIKCLREGLPLDMNVYDAAALSAVGPLSEWSVANGSRPVAIPDFTRGRWESWPAWDIVRA
ncbi:MAG: Gfo/Idh/MocA family oxidoreductase [Gemmatimonadetes bacterium]|nr:Gfo/Idh/MocA family oxidoreductase [Gemmatimonadota bacterium]MBT8402267.1 Gfo/Idh/MocA family oxidoreductase [Gemmatimonadota bacterium]